MDKDMEDVDRRYEWLHLEHSSAAGDIFGEPQRSARIGDEYQAQIPMLMTENKQHNNNNKTSDVENRFRFGLSIPVIWIHNQHKKKKKDKSVGKDSLVPGSPSESWSGIEHDSFLLGLYIFGKNLGVVNKFVGNKGMRNVLCNYYGKFYRSGEHQKWSRFRKKRSRRSVPGKKIFNGWRRQELLSRLLAHLTDESKTSLTQVTRMFEEEKISFEKYVLSVRDTVGMNLLVQAVGIGKGKRDLTGRAKKSMKNKKLLELEPDEICKVLKEDGMGLISKERLNEIFWEGVWPRLLARGWHSEQPRNYTFLQNPNNNNNHNKKKQSSLVFLAPGIAKFSRRSLEKGSQYFDSFTQLLNKVASEPWLLKEHKPAADQDKDKDSRMQVEADDKQDLMMMMKYTIVDTSLAGVVKTTNFPLPQQQQSSSGETTEEESQNEDANHHNSPELHGVVGSQVCETSAVNLILNPVVSKIEQVKPVRKLKLICKPKPEHDTRNDKLSGDQNESKEDLRSKKKPRGIVIDLNNPRVGPDLECHNPVTHETSQTTTSQRELGNGGQRQSTRNRPLSTKALEALANGYLSPKKKRRGSEDGTTRRRVRAKTALVSSCGARYIDNRVDGVFSGSGASCMVTQSPK